MLCFAQDTRLIKRRDGGGISYDDFVFDFGGMRAADGAIDRRERSEFLAAALCRRATRDLCPRIWRGSGGRGVFHLFRQRHDRFRHWRCRVVPNLATAWIALVRNDGAMSVLPDRRLHGMAVAGDETHTRGNFVRA